MKKWIWLPVAMLLLASLACSLGGQDGAAEETAPPSDAAPPEEQEGGEETLPDIDPDALAGLDSYRAQWVWQWELPSGETEEMVMEIAQTRDPAAEQFTMQTDEGTMEWIRIGDTQWTNTGQGWAQMQQSEEDLTSMFGMGSFGPSDFSSLLSDVEGQDYLGRESVNGLSALHYRLDLDPAQIVLLTQGTVSDVDGEVWIADESGLPAFVVRYVMRWEGVAPTGGEERGNVEWSYEVFDVNSPITIEPPEGTTETGLPDDIPAYPEVSELFAMEAMVSFTTSDAPATVADFYRQQLPAQGWTAASDEDFAGTVMQSWTKDGRQVDVVITSQDGGASVVISLTEP
jgi:hypothetical protein